MSDIKTREQITIPISPLQEVSDKILYESADGSQLFYLPRYRIAEVLVSGKKHLRVKLNNDELNRGLTIYLEKYPARELGDVARTAQEISHKIRIFLRCNEQAELVFQDVLIQDTVIQCMLRVNSASELAELVNVITDGEYHSKFVIQRVVMIAIPYDSSRENASLKGIMKEKKAIITAMHYLKDRDNSYLEGISSLSDSEKLSLSKMSNEEALATLTVLKLRNGSEEQILNDIRDIQHKLSTILFIETQILLEEIISPNPFVFSKNIYEYIFRNMGETTGEGDGLIPYQVVWNSIFHSYYQVEDRPTIFRYLPHAFKLASLPEAPGVPHLSVQFVWGDNKPQPIGVQLTYRAVPFIDTARRAAEAEQLRQQTHQEPSFEPLTSPSKLRIAIPTGWSAENQPHIKEPIDLRQGFEDTVTLTWEGFRQVYNSLFGHTSLLKGEVIAQVNLQQQELIPFIARLDDFMGIDTPPPEPNALLQKLLASQISPKIERTIQVTTYPFMFNPPQDRLNDSVVTILIDFFERGNKISLTPDNLSVKVTLRMSVSDYVLSKSDEGDYRYQATLIYSSGQEVKRLEENGSDDNLYITLHN